MAFVFVIEHCSSLHVSSWTKHVSESRGLCAVFKRAKTKRPSTQRHMNFASSHSQPCLANSQRNLHLLLCINTRALSNCTASSKHEYESRYSLQRPPNSRFCSRPAVS